MRVIVSGASGLIGSALVSHLRSCGHEVSCLVRRAPQSGAGTIFWDPAAGIADPASLERFDAAVHLAGESIAGGRWTPERKRRILESRIQSTRLLAESLSRLASPPKVLVSASAIGYYGDRGAERLREDSPPGKGFLSEVCQGWEESTRAASQSGIRVVNPRIGIVLTGSGGALTQMLRPFRLGIGGRIGSGDQYMSWISLADLVGVIRHAIETDALAGPVNAVSPNPVTNREFTKTLGRVLGRPTVFAIPAFAIRLLLGQMADELLLAGTRVEPVKLLLSGYRFQHTELEPTLRDILR